MGSSESLVQKIGENMDVYRQVPMPLPCISNNSSRSPNQPVLQHCTATIKRAETKGKEKRCGSFITGSAFTRKACSIIIRCEAQRIHPRVVVRSPTSMSNIHLSNLRRTHLRAKAERKSQFCYEISSAVRKFNGITPINTSPFAAEISGQSKRDQ